MYTLQNTTQVLDESGNPVNFNFILEQQQALNTSVKQTQSELDILNAKIAQIYADVPQAVPANVVAAFNLVPVQQVTS